MDKTTFYNKLNINDASEFEYFENLAALLEEDDYIESNLIKDLLKDVDVDFLADATDNYFEDFLKAIPDEETSLYITVESIKRAFNGMMVADMTSDEINALADELVRFRKWYVQDSLVFDKLNKVEVSVRDARYDIQAAKLLGEKTDYDFRTAYDYEVEGYDVRISDIIDTETDDD